MAASVSVPVSSPPEPAFISYLMSPDLDHDCYFIVGNAELGEVKRIGAVKKMLLAHSLVLRAELQDSKIAEKGQVLVPDIYPDTFNHLLRYVYGYDTTSSLCFDEADNLLYVAEKYLIDSLKARLSARIMALLTPDNVCSLLNNPACFRVLELDSAITKILQYETNAVFASAPFLSLSPDALAKILEQDAMNVEEIDVWRAALKWAKHRTRSEDGQTLRKNLTKPSKLIRIYTLSLEEFCSEVVPAKVFSFEELSSVLPYLSHHEEEMKPNIIDFSNTTESRILIHRQAKIKLIGYDDCWWQITSSINIFTNSFGIELLPMYLTAYAHGVPQGQLYQCDCTLQVADITEPTSFETVTTVAFNQRVERGEHFLIPVTCNGSNVRLMPNKRYRVTVTYTQQHSMPLYATGTVSNEHLTLSLTDRSGELYISPIQALLYRPLTIRRR